MPSSGFTMMYFWVFFKLSNYHWLLCLYMLSVDDGRIYIYLCREVNIYTRHDVWIYIYIYFTDVYIYFCDVRIYIHIFIS